VTPLDRQVSDAATLLGLVLVFVIGSFAAIAPAADETAGRPIPPVEYDRQLLANRLRSQRNLLVGVEVLIVAVLAVVAPVTVRVAAHLVGRPYSVLKAGVLLVDLLLLIMFAAALVLTVRVQRRRRVVLAT
jgi:hypothetical protein